MGYTHYWSGQRDFTSVEWKAIKAGAKKIIAAAKKDGVLVAFEYTEPKQKAEISDTRIRFNGIEDEGHETFALDIQREDFTFCKTARKPYDAVVVSILAMADKVAPGALKLSSDGTEKDDNDNVISTPFDNPPYSI